MAQEQAKNKFVMTQVVDGEVKKSEMAGHAIAGVGQNLVFGIWSSYMLIFFTDIFGISAAAAATIMALTRVWDAVNDPMMGAVADRTRTKWGRYRPWLLFMAIPIAVMLVLNFSAPDLSYAGKVVWAAVTYVLMSMAFTAIDVPYWTMPAAMSRDTSKRTTIISISRASTTIASLGIGVIIVPLINSLGRGNMAKGYQLTALVIGAAGAVFYLIGFKMVKEHVTPAQAEKTGLKKALEVITKNKPLLLILLCSLVSNFGLLLRQNLMLFYVQYNLGSLDFVPLFSLLMLPGMILGVVLAPVLSRKLGQKNLYIYVSLFGVIVNLIYFFAGYSNIALVSVLYALSMLPIGITMVLCSSMLANSIEYAEWKTGQRREGLISSTQTFITKLGIAMGVGMSGIVLTISNYVPNAVQEASTLTTFHVAFTLVAAIFGFLGIIPMFFNDLTDKRHAQIVAELEQRRAAKEAQ